MVNSVHAYRANSRCRSEANIHRLPLEVIAYIFEIYVNNYESHHLKGALLLGAVSLAWHHISQRNPQLWDKFYFDLKPETTETQIQLAIESFNRSGALPVSVTLSVDMDPYLTEKAMYLTEEAIFPLVDTINQSLTRCRSVSLSIFSHMTLSIFTPMQGPSILENLKLHSVDFDPSFDLGPQAAPTKLDIVGIELDSLAINWPNITHFRASGLCTSEIVESLILTPQMKVCQQDRIMGGGSTRVVMHPQLECLEITELSQAPFYICDFLGKITLPGLIDCKVNTHIFPVTKFLQFLTCSSCAIKNLSIDSFAISGTDLVELAKALPSITSLTIIKSDDVLAPLAMPPLERFYNALCMDPRYNFNADGDILLPSLQHLSIQTWLPFPWKWLPGICNRYHDNGDKGTTSPGRAKLKSISILRTIRGNPFERGNLSLPVL